MSEIQGQATKTGIHQDQVPWSRRWNWLFTHPEKVTSNQALFCGCMLLVGAVASVYLLGTGNAQDWFSHASSWMQVGLGAMGFAQLGSGS